MYRGEIQKSFQNNKNNSIEIQLQNHTTKLSCLISFFYTISGLLNFSTPHNQRKLYLDNQRKLYLVMIRKFNPNVNKHQPEVPPRRSCYRSRNENGDPVETKTRRETTGN